MSYKNEFKNCLDGLFESLCDVSDWMYENPELGFQEFKTSKYLVDYIQKNSKSVNYPSHGLETAFDITFGEENMMPYLKLAMHVDITLLQQRL
jgi:metal-dependent amidase/aminoacylase/carboxypeptidase family protein